MHRKPTITYKLQFTYLKRSLYGNWVTLDSFRKESEAIKAFKNNRPVFSLPRKYRIIREEVVMEVLKED